MTATGHHRIYRVKSVSGVETLMRVLHEEQDGYRILITSRSDGRHRTSEEFMSRDLLESCLRTGYLTEVAEEALSAGAV